MLNDYSLVFICKYVVNNAIDYTLYELEYAYHVLWLKFDECGDELQCFLFKFKCKLKVGCLVSPMVEHKNLLFYVWIPNLNICSEK